MTHVIAAASGARIAHAGRIKLNAIGWIVLLLVLVMSRPAVAQRPVDTRKPFPSTAELPRMPTDVVESYDLAYALATPMVELDPALPALDIEAWLNVTSWEEGAFRHPGGVDADVV